MAKVRQARRCRARSSRTRQPCKAFAIVGGDVCRAHGGAIGRVRLAAAQRRERELVLRAMHRAEQRHAQEVEAWLTARLEEAAREACRGHHARRRAALRGAVRAPGPSR